MRIEYRLDANPANLNMLGVYEDVVVCYENVMKLYDDVVYSNINPKYGACTLFREDIHRLCKSKVKKVLNAFYKEHLDVFTGDDMKIYVNDDSLKGIYFIKNESAITQNRNLGFKYNYRHIPIDMFIFNLELIAAYLICIRRQSAGIKTDFQANLLRINRRIVENVKKVREESIKNMDEMGWQFVCPKLYIFSSLINVSCRRNEHEVVPDVCIVPLSGRDGKAVLLPIHTCKTCGKKFIGYQSYKLFCEEYGVLILERYPDESLTSDEFLEFKSESQLHRLGYNVIYGKLTDEERKDLLVTLLEHRILSYLEISKTIENNIRIFEYRSSYENAVKKWKQDLLFIGNYVIDNPDLR